MVYSNRYIPLHFSMSSSSAYFIQHAAYFIALNMQCDTGHYYPHTRFFPLSFLCNDFSYSPVLFAIALFVCFFFKFITSASANSVIIRLEVQSRRFQCLSPPAPCRPIPNQHSRLSSLSSQYQCDRQSSRTPRRRRVPNNTRSYARVNKNLRLQCDPICVLTTVL